MLKKKILKLLILFLLFYGLCMFLISGTFNFWEAWLYLFVLSVPMVFTLYYLLKNDPALLERRLRTEEKEKKEKFLVKFFRLPFIIGYIIPALDHRFNWSEIPIFIVLFSNALVFIGYMIVHFVFRENSYTSRIVEVEENQKVISTGPYSIVRHPMYSGTSLMYLFTPLALGSYWALLIFALLPIVLIIRIYDEEKVLKQKLPGYQEYCLKTRYRLIPFIW